MAQLVEIDPAGPLLCIDLDLLVRDPGPRPQVHNRARSATPLTYTLRVEQLSAMNPSASSGRTCCIRQGQPPGRRQERMDQSNHMIVQRPRRAASS